MNNTNELTDIVFTHIIRFKDRSKKKITEASYNAIFKLSVTPNGTTKFTLQGQMYDLNGVDKLMSLEEYYEQYPNERPAPQKILTSTNSFVKRAPDYALKGMTKGLEQFIAERDGKVSQQVKDMLTNIQQRRKLIIPIKTI